MIKMKIYIIIVTIFAVALLSQLVHYENLYKKEVEYQKKWTSFYCLNKESKYKTDIQPHLTMDRDLDGKIIRVSVMCQGDPID